jgi:hypothetical protein
MIISFNFSIFQSQDDEIQATLAEILIGLMKTNIHFIHPKSINAIFYKENGEYIFDSNAISKRHLSIQEQRNLKEFLRKKSLEAITDLHKRHFVHIIVGLDESKKEIHPKMVCEIIKERSKIIVENGINDWKFIQGICQKYSGGRTKRQSIYKLIDRAIKEQIIEPEHAGGVGEIPKVTKRWIENERYKNIFQYKLMAIFDSDRENPDELTRNKCTIEYFRGRIIDNTNACKYESTDLIIWHMLYKKKIENYIPLNVLFTSLESITSITKAQEDSLNTKTYKELDFMEYTKDNIGIGKQSRKEQFPNMFLSNFSYHEFEKRCGHHKVFLEEANELVSEIEQILLKIAKII